MISTDLHMHSCLSPCGDDDATPFDIVGIAKLNGLELIALTDHNSVKNCAAAALAAAEYDIGFIPGVEVTTSEDIHCVCLFPDLDSAEKFGELLDSYMPGIKNKPQVFGNQIVYLPDSTTSTEPHLLIIASGISIMDLPEMVANFGGICYPAHVDRDANGLFAMLGSWPEELVVPAVEIHDTLPDGTPSHLPVIRASDAHRLMDIPEVGFELPLKTADFAGLKEYLENYSV